MSEKSKRQKVANARKRCSIVVFRFGYCRNVEESTRVSSPPFVRCLAPADPKPSSFLYVFDVFPSQTDFCDDGTAVRLSVGQWNPRNGPVLKSGRSSERPRAVTRRRQWRENVREDRLLRQRHHQRGRESWNRALFSFFCATRFTDQPVPQLLNIFFVEMDFILTSCPSNHTFIRCPHTLAHSLVFFFPKIGNLFSIGFIFFKG